ncbi:hypothetical protein TIFTF001_021916 [Ficus carica]|uniref:Uncharacterized protein n=1 Tax=Ficus carica TaxID=3494 RepID=A0AA88DB65_FICCA|nr:hypothetical protein TIFTF001_021916 [Ficus carica]
MRSRYKSGPHRTKKKFPDVRIEIGAPISHDRTCKGCDWASRGRQSWQWEEIATMGGHRGRPMKVKAFIREIKGAAVIRRATPHRREGDRRHSLHLQAIFNLVQLRRDLEKGDKIWLKLCPIYTVSNEDAAEETMLKK